MGINKVSRVKSVNRVSRIIGAHKVCRVSRVSVSSHSVESVVKRIIIVNTVTNVS